MTIGELLIHVEGTEHEVHLKHLRHLKHLDELGNWRSPKALLVRRAIRPFSQHIDALEALGNCESIAAFRLTPHYEKIKNLKLDDMGELNLDALASLKELEALAELKKTNRGIFRIFGK